MSTSDEQHPTKHAAKGGHTTSIIINARSYDIETKDLSYADVVSLAYNGTPPVGENVIITVTYSRGENGQEGSMLPGDTVKAKHKMVFNVSATDRS